MTLDCPGCKSKLKLDPAKLPPGASAAVCPKCRTRILLPGTSAAEEISVQCGQCSSRLKVKVARLKPRSSKSKCPKCGGLVELPAAPARPGDGQATRVMQAPPPAPPPGVDRSAMTRRLDAKEMGMLMGGEGAGGGAAGQQPIEDAVPSGAFRSSSADLGRLIDEKVDALGGGGEAAPPPPAPRPGEASVEDLPIEMPPVTGESSGAPGPDPVPAPPPPARAPERAPSSPGARRPSASSGARSVPTFSTAIPPGARTGSGGKRGAFITGGLIGASVVAGGLVLGGQFLPEGTVPPVPEALTGMIGGYESMARLVAMVVLSVLSAVLASFALPPEGEGGGVSIFRCTVAAGLVGLLAGVGISLVRGGTDLTAMILPTASWTVSLIIAGLLTGVVARIFASR